MVRPMPPRPPVTSTTPPWRSGDGPIVGNGARRTSADVAAVAAQRDDRRWRAAPRSSASTSSSRPRRGAGCSSRRRRRGRGASPTTAPPTARPTASRPRGGGSPGTGRRSMSKVDDGDVGEAPGGITRTGPEHGGLLRPRHLVGAGRPLGAHRRHGDVQRALQPRRPTPGRGTRGSRSRAPGCGGRSCCRAGTAVVGGQQGEVGDAVGDVPGADQVAERGPRSRPGRARARSRTRRR